VLIHTRCPIDDTDAHDVEVYRANFDLDRVDAHSFSARRRPDGIHYRMVRNTRTGCLRADPILDEKTILRFYRDSGMTYADVAEFAAQSYLRYVSRALPRLPDKRGVLEIGCGHGFLLEHLARMGFDKVAGVEPSEDAVARASPAIRPHIVPGVLESGLFAAETFSLVCAFQVLDHLVRPNETLQACRDLLAPGGVALCVCHDEGSVFARLLGRRSPIIDIEHVVLYNRRTIARLFEKNGFRVVAVFGVSNRYPLSYWSHLAPAPELVKLAVLKFLTVTRLGRLTLAANLGNMGILARKPDSPPR
jgi:SAM-dependent methyltransferase